MANYYATARSNYFKVKCEEKFREWADDRQLDILENDDGDGYAVTPMDNDGMWPNYDGERDIDFCVFEEIADHLQKNQVAVFMEAGAEKLRYVSGTAIAVHSTGKTVQVTLGDIYGMAADSFGKEAVITAAEY